MNFVRVFSVFLCCRAPSLNENLHCTPTTLYSRLSFAESALRAKMAGRHHENTSLLQSTPQQSGGFLRRAGIFMSGTFTPSLSLPSPMTLLPRPFFDDCARAHTLYMT